MKKSFLGLIPALLMLLFSACDRSGAAVPDVYVAGYEVNEKGKAVATLWKNGKAERLSDGSSDMYAMSVYVSGKDVYVVGCDNWAEPSNSKVAMLWKNGKTQSLGEGKKATYAKSVFVADDNVYVLGYEARYGMLWVNGTPKPLAMTMPLSLFVSSADIYVAGVDASWNSSKPVLHKNDVSQELNYGKGLVFANSVYVKGTDVYVAGFEESDFFGGKIREGRLWKNGEPQRLKYMISTIQSVFVSDNNVYAAGRGIANGKNNYLATLWKNEEPQFLSDGSYGANALSVHVSDNDVYVVGFEENAYKKSLAVLWTNGDKMVLGEGMAFSVFIK